MEDDRIAENADKLSGGKILGGLGAFLVFAVVCAFLWSPGGSKGKAEGKGSVVTQQPAAAKGQPVAQVAPVESKAQYIKSTRAITVTKSKGIYYKDFLKNPDKYKGDRIRASVKIVSIEEKEGNTFMNVALTTNYEMAVVAYKGSVDVYKGDIVTIYGEGLGTVPGKNAMGAEMTWPGILAKYVKKIRTDEED